jgi:hypothetical protein
MLFQSLCHQTPTKLLLRTASLSTDTTYFDRRLINGLDSARVGCIPPFQGLRNKTESLK